VEFGDVALVYYLPFHTNDTLNDDFGFFVLELQT